MGQWNRTLKSGLCGESPAQYLPPKKQKTKNKPGIATYQVLYVYKVIKLTFLKWANV